MAQFSVGANMYINGIQNTQEVAFETGLQIRQRLTQSPNHPAPAKRELNVVTIWNPIGFTGAKIDPLTSLQQDRMEVFIEKTAEEWFAPDLGKLIAPHTQAAVSLDAGAAAGVAKYLSVMTPGNNSLEKDQLIFENDMAATKATIWQLINRVKSFQPSVVVAHSQGNLLANLAYAQLVVEKGNDVHKMMRVVNIANTTKYSINGLSLTSMGDAVLYSSAQTTPIDISLEALPSFGRNWTRTTPECLNDAACNFKLAAPTFGYPEPRPQTLDANHTMPGTYLSTAKVPIINAQGVTFTQGADRFIDRFEDLVYAAVTSLENSNAPKEQDCGGLSPGQSVLVPLPAGYDRSFSGSMNSSGCTIVYSAFNANNSGLPVVWKRETDIRSSKVDLNPWQELAVSDSGSEFYTLCSNQICSTNTLTWDQKGVSTNASGLPQNGSLDVDPARVVTPSGRFITFRSTASNLVAGVGGPRQIFQKDLQTGTVVCASCSNPLSGTRNFSGGSSSDGRYILYNIDSQIGFRSFMYDVVLGTSKALGNSGWYSELSPSGRFAFGWQQATLVVLDTTTLVITPLITCNYPSVDCGMRAFFSPDETFLIVSVGVRPPNAPGKSMVVEMNLKTMVVSQSALPGPPDMLGGGILGVGTGGRLLLIGGAVRNPISPTESLSRLWLSFR